MRLVVGLASAGFHLSAAAIEIARHKAAEQKLPAPWTAAYSTLLRSISTNQELVDRYFATLSGVCSIEEFYTEELLEILADN